VLARALQSASNINPDFPKKGHASSNARRVLRLARRDRALAINGELESKLAGKARAHAGDANELKRTVQAPREKAGSALLR